MNDMPLKQNVPMVKEVERKELEDHTAKKLSANPNEPVEKSIVKKSEDEARSKPN